MPILEVDSGDPFFFRDTIRTDLVRVHGKKTDHGPFIHKRSGLSRVPCFLVLDRNNQIMPTKTNTQRQKKRNKKYSTFDLNEVLMS